MADWLHIDGHCCMGRCLQTETEAEINSNILPHLAQNLTKPYFSSHFLQNLLKYLAFYI